MANPSSRVMKFWKKEDYPLLFDKSYRPRKIYFAFQDAVKQGLTPSAAKPDRKPGGEGRKE